MIRSLRALALAACLLLLQGPSFAAPSEEPPVPEPIAQKGYHLVKNWDFGKNILTLQDLRREFHTRYASNNGTLDHLGNEWEVYRDHDNHVLSDGVLHLVARAPKGVLKAGAIESGMIRSKWETRYGYFEARMKMPKGRGMWPAFWSSAISWPPELDVVEIVHNDNNSPNVSFHSLHGKYVGKTLFSRLNQYDNYAPGFDYTDGFHTFAVEWTPTSVKHYVDGVLVVEREFLWKHNDGKLGDPTPLVINLAVGGNWPGEPKSLADFPASLDVAYVRVWQK